MGKANRKSTSKAQRQSIDYANALELQFDSINYRLPEELKNQHQPKLLHTLIEHYDVLEIAESISERGFYQHEALIVVKEGSKLIVVEGNRRLAACRALLLPDELENGWKKKFKSLAAITDISEIEQLPIFIYPSREKAIDLIESLHTKPGRKKWDTLSKARFDKDYRADDKNRLAQANKILDTYHIALSLPIAENIKKIVADESKFNVTNLMRIFNDENCKKYLAYDYDEKGNIKIKIKADQFAKAAAPIINDVATSRNFSRVTDTPDMRKSYINKRKQDVELDYSKKANLTANGFTKEIKSFKNSEGNSSTQIKTKVTKVKKKNIIPNDLQCEVTYPRIKAIFNELKNLPLKDNENATGILFRVLIEISLYKFLESKGEILKIKAEKARELQSKKTPQKLSPDWAPDLRKMLHWTYDNDLLGMPHVNKSIHRLILNKENPILSDLNQFVHNSEFIVLENDLITIWRDIEPLVREILKKNEPTKK